MSSRLSAACQAHVCMYVCVPLKICATNQGINQQAEAGLVQPHVFALSRVVQCCLMSSDVVRRRLLTCAVFCLCVTTCQAFYNGFMPNFARLGSWNVAMFLMLEQVRVFCWHADRAFQSTSTHVPLCSRLAGLTQCPATGAAPTFQQYPNQH